jgi:imidazoleglycerol phosphate synthase glutamine amidotransferase subunit HisH
VRSRSLQVSSAADVDAADRLIFPGVGAYEQAMGALAQKGLTTALRDYVQVTTRGASG